MVFAITLQLVDGDGKYKYEDTKDENITILVTEDLHVVYIDNVRNLEEERPGISEFEDYFILSKSLERFHISHDGFEYWHGYSMHERIHMMRITSKYTHCFAKDVIYSNGDLTDNDNVPVHPLLLSKLLSDTFNMNAFVIDLINRFSKKFLQTLYDCRFILKHEYPITRPMFNSAYRNAAARLSSMIIRSKISRLEMLCSGRRDATDFPHTTHDSLFMRMILSKFSIMRARVPYYIAYSDGTVLPAMWTKKYREDESNDIIYEIAIPGKIFNIKFDINSFSDFENYGMLDLGAPTQVVEAEEADLGKWISTWMDIIEEPSKKDDSKPRVGAKALNLLKRVFHQNKK